MIWDWDDIIIEIKCTINVMTWMIPRPSPPHPPMREKLVSHETQILVPKRLGTTRGQRSLAGGSPRGCRESGPTGRRSTAEPWERGLETFGNVTARGRALQASRAQRPGVRQTPCLARGSPNRQRLSAPIGTGCVWEARLSQDVQNEQSYITKSERRLLSLLCVKM